MRQAARFTFITSCLLDHPSLKLVGVVEVGTHSQSRGSVGLGLNPGYFDLELSTLAMSYSTIPLSPM